MAMEESATTGILSDQSHIVFIGQQRGICHRFRKTPIHFQLAGQHFRAIVNDLLHAAMQFDIRRDLRDRLAQRLDFLCRQGGIHFIFQRGFRITRPVNRVLIADHAEMRLVACRAFIHAGTIFIDHVVDRIGIQHLFRDQLVGVQLASGFVLLDDPVHGRLGCRRFVRLVMTMPAIADQVDHHVLVEQHAVFQRQSRRINDGFRIIAIDMNDRRFQHLGNFRAIRRRACILRIADGETDLVVADDMHGAAGIEPARL